jgi:valyl-tRNA synthetase
MISTQWFVKIKPLAEAGLEAVRDGRIRIVPERFSKVYYNWLENIRRLVHQPPAVVGPPHPGLVLRRLRRDDRGTRGPGPLPALRQCASSRTRTCWTRGFVRPVAVLHARLARRHARLPLLLPDLVMETGYDILFFWVARMIMMGWSSPGKPFHTVYLHGLIRDETGAR